MGWCLAFPCVPLNVLTRQAGQPPVTLTVQQGGRAPGAVSIFLCPLPAQVLW